MSIRHIKCGVTLGVAILALAMVSAGTASANLSFSTAAASLVGPDGQFARQAGSHPDFTMHIALPTTTDPNDGIALRHVVEEARDIDVDLPVGFVGNPTAFATCSPSNLANAGTGAPACPVASQVGVAHVLGTNNTDAYVAVYNLEHGPNVPAAFGFQYYGTIATIQARVRPDDYGISAGSFSISQAVAVDSVDLTLWGVPAASSHDLQRQAFGVGQIIPNDPHSTDAPLAPFISLPTSCDAPASFTIRGDSWEHPGVFDTRTITADADGAPFVFDGCEHLPFSPSIAVQPLSHTADAPTGLAVDVRVPQNDAWNGLSTADVRKVAVTFPKGMSVSPSSAAGLGACSPAQIGLGTNDAPTCPASSKIGSVTINTPLLPDPLNGDVILAAQNDNPFHSLIAMYLAVPGPGFELKLPGRVDLDQNTGQITATFDNTPQLPFSSMELRLQGGSQAPLATPTECGTYTTHTEITSWASSTPVAIDTPMSIDQGCAAPAFSPSLTAGPTNPQAGQYSPFVFNVTRADGQPMLARIDASLPSGLLAQIGSVPQCPQAVAAAGTCPATSQVGSVNTLAGPGAQPLGLTGRVYLTGPYKNPATGQDAPFGLSIAVPTAGQAGPFDLGIVVVRAGIYVDRTDAHVTVKSDPLPTIIDGIPLRLRQVRLAMDRPRFMINPTSCRTTGVFGSFGATNGATSNQAVQFAVGGCGDLELNQKLALTFKGSKSTTDGTHPGIDAKLTDAGGANLQKAEVKLPLSVALDPDNAQGLCTPVQRAALNCPKSSIVGTARAVSVLPDPLTGPVYFVEGTRRSASGRTIRTLPKLWIPLSADGVTIDVNADSAVDSIERLVTTFHDIPDAPIKEFDLSINGGKHGIIVVSGKPGTCDRDKTIDSRFTAQTGEVKVQTTKVKVEGCKPSVTRSKVTSRSITLRIANIGAGKITLSGSKIKQATRSIKVATEATLTARLTAPTQAAIRHHKKVSLEVVIGYRRVAGRAVRVTHTVTVRP